MAHTQTVNAAQAATIRVFMRIARESGNTIEVHANPSSVVIVEWSPNNVGLLWVIDSQGNADLESSSIPDSVLSAYQRESYAIGEEGR